MKITFTIILSIISFSAQAETLQVNKIYGPQEEYQFNLLKLVLNKHSSKKYELQQSNSVLNETQMQEKLDSQSLDVMWAATKNSYEERMRPIRVPLFKGLLGHRVFIIREDNQAKFNSINDIDDLMAFKAGQGRGWADTDILRNADLSVITTMKYSNLFSMLEGGRFDYFPRGVHEPWGELAARPELPLTVEKRVLLIYPLAAYFFVQKDNVVLANDIKNGFMKAIEDGSFEQFFSNHQIIKSALEKSDLTNRVIIKIENPFMPTATPYDDEKLWFDIDSLNQDINIDQAPNFDQNNSVIH